MPRTNEQSLYSLAPFWFDERYARFDVIGTYVLGPSCPECGCLDAKRLSPLVIQWQVERWGPGRDTISDLVWSTGARHLLATQRVRDYLERRVSGIQFGPVEMIDDPKLHRPKRMTKRTKKRVWLPYDGPPLHEIIVEKVVHLDIERSGRMFTLCPGCGRRQFKVKRGAQNIVPRSEWTGEDFFRIDEIGGLKGPAFVTQHARDLLKAGRFTNLSIRKCGAIVP